MKSEERGTPVGMSKDAVNPHIEAARLNGENVGKTIHDGVRYAATHASLGGAMAVNFVKGLVVRSLRG